MNRWPAVLVVPLLLVSGCAAASDSKESTGAPAGSGTPSPSASTDLQLAQQRWMDDTDVQTVPDLFAFIADATENGADVVDVDYDVDLGYPKQIDVDYLVNAIDDEACYTVKDFEPLGRVDEG